MALSYAFMQCTGMPVQPGACRTATDRPAAARGPNTRCHAMRACAYWCALRARGLRTNATVLRGCPTPTPCMRM